MKVSDLIEWLKTQDQDAIVEVLYHSSGRDYYEQGGVVSVEEFEASVDQYDYVDFRGNKHVKETDGYFNKRYLRLGTRDN